MYGHAAVSDYSRYIFYIFAQLKATVQYLVFEFSWRMPWMIRSVALMIAFFGNLFRMNMPILQTGIPAFIPTVKGKG